MLPHLLKRSSLKKEMYSAEMSRICKIYSMQYYRIIISLFDYLFI